MKHFEAFINQERIVCLDKQLDTLQSNQTTHAINGYAHVVVVKENDTYIGWMVKEAS